MSVQSDIAIRQSAIGGAIWRNRLLLTLALMHVCAALGIAQVLNLTFNSGTLWAMMLQLKVMVPLFLMLAGYCRYRWIMIYVKPESNMQWFKADMRRILLDPDRILTGSLAFLTFVLFCGTFTFLKESIPAMVPFSWDPAFARLDRALHFGMDPWRLLQPVFGSAIMTSFLNVIYHLWFFMMYFMVLWACFDIRQIRKSATFLVAFVLTWVIGGNFLATIYSSVGPVYYQEFGFGDSFVPLMQHLEAVNQVTRVWALDVQAMLLDGYRNDGAVKGISAMPSMHVGSTVVMTLFCFAHKRWLGWVMVGFTTLIVIGSVHLAWHYAVDAYAAIIIALVCWWASRLLVRRFDPAL